MKFDDEYRGIRINGKSPIAGWFRMEHTIYKWMITGGSPISGNLRNQSDPWSSEVKVAGEDRMAKVCFLHVATQRHVWILANRIESHGLTGTSKHGYDWGLIFMGKPPEEYKHYGNDWGVIFMGNPIIMAIPVGGWLGLTLPHRGWSEGLPGLP